MESKSLPQLEMIWGEWWGGGTKTNPFGFFYLDIYLLFFEKMIFCVHEWFYIAQPGEVRGEGGGFWRLANILYVKLRVEDGWV